MAAPRRTDARNAAATARSRARCGSARAALGLRQARDRRVRPRARRARRRAGLDRRHGARSWPTAGLEVRAIEDFTGFPEIMDGRVKTLHPKLYAGLLAVRDDPEHLRAAAEHDVEFVDLVVRQPLPVRAHRRRGPARRDAEVIENIDIGGPTMIRAAAKNHAYTAVVTSPESYDAILDELRGSDGRLSMTTRESLAADAFATTARYDTAIARWFAERSDDDFPPLHVRAYEKVLDLSYGENPHQRAAYYARVGARTHLLSMVRQHHGKAALVQQPARPRRGDAGSAPSSTTTPAAVIVKHNNPCGCALGDERPGGLPCERSSAIRMSAYGGVVVLNTRVDREFARGARRAVHRGAVRPRATTRTRWRS